MTTGFYQTLLMVAAAVVVINIPFGFWRDSVRRFSLRWILAIHLPVPMVIGLRLVSHLGWQLSTFPVLIGSFFLGQFLGGRLHRWWGKQ
ncbi:MAG: hypothetical protein WCI03_15015 [bacterium]